MPLGTGAVYVTINGVYLSYLPAIIFTVLDFIPLPLLYFSERKPETIVDTIVVHSMYNSQVGEDQRFSPERCADILNHHQTSAHYLISLSGEVFECIPEEKRAKHAGESRLPYPDDSREDVGNFSIGIELIGDWTDPRYVYPQAQYQSLSDLIKVIATRHPIVNVVGHDHIAPGRKSDPGAHFNWRILKELLGERFRIYGSDEGILSL